MTNDSENGVAVVEDKIEKAEEEKEEETKKVEETESDFIKDCKSLFGSLNLYEILNLTKESSIDGVKKAYHGLTYKIHADRTDDEINNKKCQVLAQIYNVLSNNDERKQYDESNNSISFTPSKSTGEEWRSLFNEMSCDDLIKYKDSEDEKEDLIRLYKKHNGDMSLVLKGMFIRQEDSLNRFQKTIQNSIDNDKLEPLGEFKATVVSTNGDETSKQEVDVVIAAQEENKKQEDDEMIEEDVETPKKGKKAVAAAKTTPARKTPTRGSKTKAKETSAAVAAAEDEDFEKEVPIKETPARRGGAKSKAKKEELVEKDDDKTPVKKLNGKKATDESVEEIKGDNVVEEEIVEKKSAKKRKAPPPPKRDRAPTRRAAKNVSYVDNSDEDIPEEYEDEEVRFDDASSDVSFNAGENDSDEDYGKKSKKKSPSKNAKSNGGRASKRAKHSI